jgi:hypothetical protein
MYNNHLVRDQYVVDLEVKIIELRAELKEEKSKVEFLENEKKRLTSALFSYDEIIVTSLCQEDAVCFLRWLHGSSKKEATKRYEEIHLGI